MKVYKKSINVYINNDVITLKQVQALNSIEYVKCAECDIRDFSSMVTIIYIDVEEISTKEDELVQIMKEQGFILTGEYFGSIMEVKEVY